MEGGPTGITISIFLSWKVKLGGVAEEELEQIQVFCSCILLCCRSHVLFSFAMFILLFTLLIYHAVFSAICNLNLQIAGFLSRDGF
jgi:hypothetical protein